jgi:hypothetical protein
MYDKVLMQVQKGTEKLFDDFGYKLFTVVRIFIDVIENGSALAVLSDYVVEVVVVVEFIDFYDVRVVEFGQ